MFDFYRTIVKEHIPKRHLDFENAITTDKVFDNTSNRIYGERNQPAPFVSEMQGQIGKSYNPADNLPKVGKKTQQSEHEVSFSTNISKL